MIPATLNNPDSDPTYVAVTMITDAYQRGAQDARDGVGGNPSSVPGVRLTAQSREAYTRGYEEEIAKEEKREEQYERWEEEVAESGGYDEDELEAREEWARGCTL